MRKSEEKWKMEDRREGRRENESRDGKERGG